MHKFENSLGIERADMPQIKAAVQDDFVSWVYESWRKTSHYTETPVNILKPTQSSYNLDKALSMGAELDIDELRANILVSNDGYVLDGHHRYAAMLRVAPDMCMHTTIVDVGIRTLIKLANEFGGTTYER